MVMIVYKLDDQYERLGEFCHDLSGLSTCQVECASSNLTLLCVLLVTDIPFS